MNQVEFVLGEKTREWNEANELASEHAREHYRTVKIITTTTT